MKERYDNLDGLRAISCLGIIMMHIKANADYSIQPGLRSFMASWTHFVLLFLVISGFGMFCGYYEKFKNGSINLNSFYSRRYKKLLPFFMTLVLIDIAMARNCSHLIEGFTELTLVFGLLPNNQPNVIGVSWTLGVIFLFYMLFPFFVFLFWNKKRAWMTFLTSIIISVFCTIYFFTDTFVVDGFIARHSFLYCAPFFSGGAMVYLYRDSIKRIIAKHRWICLLLCICFSIICFLLPDVENYADLFILLRYLALFIIWLMYAISVDSKVLSNKVSKYLSGISLEMYLSHMLMFRVVEKINGLYIFGHGLISMFTAFILVIVALLAFIWMWVYMAGIIDKKLEQ